MGFVSSLSSNTALVKSKAYELGFSFCGISKAIFLEKEAPHLENWLAKNMQGQMSYMENHFDKRLDPRLLVDDARSVISLMFNYYPSIQQKDPTAPKISKYAYGEDYHFIIKDKLKELLFCLRENIGEINGRAFVDSAPVLDRAWAKSSGLGWVGKNSNLINKQSGSFFFIAELIIDLPLEYDNPVKDFCGNCTKCIDACPTDAIVNPYIVDGSKCISYFTIELKGEIPKNFTGHSNNWAFGCDICQDVCPWNRFSKPHKEERLNASENIINMSKKDWDEITEDVFNEIAKKSPLKRAKFKGLKRNIEFLNSSVEGFRN